MVTIRVKTRDGAIKTLAGTSNKPIHIDTRGGDAAALYAYTDKNNVVISAAVAPKADWYELYLSKKRRMMLSGGAGTGFSFAEGLLNSYIIRNGSPYLATVADCPPHAGGDLHIIGDRDVVLYPGAGVLNLGATSHSKEFFSLLSEIYLFTWALYHAINHLQARIVKFDPTKSDNTFNCLGTCRGTLLEYQAQLAVYNRQVWQSSYLFNVDTVVEKVAVGLGYAAQDCHVGGVLCLLSIKPTDDIAAGSDNLIDAFNALTVFRYGKSTGSSGLSVNTDDIDIRKVAIVKLSDYGAKTIAGTGFDGNDKSYGIWNEIKIAVLLGPMERKQRYYEVFTLAVGSGVLSELELPESADGSVRFSLDISSDCCVLPDDISEDALNALSSRIENTDWYTNSDLLVAAAQYAEPIHMQTTATPLAVNVVATDDNASGAGGAS